MTDTLERLRAALRETYAVDRQVGQGGMATVFLAEDLKHHRQVAIKVLRPELSATLGSERFLREIQLAAKLQHPHIVPLYDSGSADGLLYYVMPFVDGESLRELLDREGRLPVRRAAEIAREVASGLAYAHKQGIVHRDVKPENIMLSGGSATVADFGIARAVDVSRTESSALTGTGSAIGTPAYMSPEQATAEAVDARTDQYALACVFYKMVSGAEAFTAPNMQVLLTRVLTGARPRLSVAVPGTSPAIDAAVARAMDLEPDRRFPDIMAFADTLVGESGVVPAPVHRTPGRARAWFAMAVAVSVATALWLGLGGSKRLVVAGAETIAVVPFATSGADVASLGEGMVDLLSPNLDGVGPIHTAEQRQVIRAWEKRVGKGSASLDDAIAVAGSVGAASVLTGSVVSSGGKARLTGDLYDLQSKHLAHAQVDGASDSAIVLADRLSLALLRDIWRSREPLPSARTSGIASTSIDAIRAYLDGEKWYRRGQWDSATAAFQLAVKDDSTFAMGWYRLANSRGWAQVAINAAGSTGAVEANANAIRYSAALSPRIRSLAIGQDLYLRSDPAGVDSLRAYTAQYPRDADGWYLLGEAQYHTRSFGGYSPDDLLQPFDKVLALDSALVAAAIHPVELSMDPLDTTRAERYLAVLRAANDQRDLRQGQAMLAIARGATTNLDSLVRVAGDSRARTVVHGRMLTPGLGHDELLALLNAYSLGTWLIPREEEKRWKRVVEWGNREVLGELRLADSLVDSVAAFFHAPAKELRLSQSLSRVDCGLAPPALLDSITRAPLTDGDDAEVRFYRALSALDLGHFEQVRHEIDAALALSDSDITPSMRGAIAAIDGLRMAIQGKPALGVARVDSALGRSRRYQNRGDYLGRVVLLRLAVILAGRAETRGDGIRRLRYGSIPQLFEHVPVTEYFLGHAYEAAGDRANAIAAYEAFARLWEKADLEFQPRVTEAKEAARRLKAASAH